MTLEEHLKTKPRHIYLLWFSCQNDDVNELNTSEYKRNDFNKIEKRFLKMEVMDIVSEEDYEEIWIR